MTLVSRSASTESGAKKSGVRPRQKLRIVAAVSVSVSLTFGQQALPYRDPGQLVAVWERVDPGARSGGLSGPQVGEFRKETINLFSSFGGFTIQDLWLIDKQG